MQYTINLTFDDGAHGTGYVVTDAQGVTDYDVSTDFGPVVPGVQYCDTRQRSFADIEGGALVLRRAKCGRRKVMTLERNFQPHPSHDMTDWESDIVTLVSTPRFGRIRQCRKCEAEQAETAGGAAHDDELERPCYEVCGGSGADSRPRAGATRPPARDDDEETLQARA